VYIVLFLIIMISIMSIIFYIQTSSIKIQEERYVRTMEYVNMPAIGTDINGHYYGITENMTIRDARSTYYAWSGYPQTKHMVNNIIRYICEG